MMKIFSPLELEILINAYYTPCLHASKEEGSHNALGFLNSLGLINELNQITERGRFHVEAILALPLPEQKWYTPQKEQTPADKPGLQG